MPQTLNRQCNFGQIRRAFLDRKYCWKTEKAEGKMAKLTSAERKELPKGDFVYPKTRRYPIEDAAHARDALARSSGKPEHAKVVAAVKRKFPEIDAQK